MVNVTSQERLPAAAVAFITLLTHITWPWMKMYRHTFSHDLWLFFFLNIFAIHLDINETENFSGPRFCGHTGALKTQKKRTTAAFLLPLCQFDNYSAFKLLSQWKGKLVHVLTRWIWSGKAKNSWEATDLATTFPPWSKPYHYQTRWQALENRSNLINPCCLCVSKCFHLFNFLLSGLLLPHWPKEKCFPCPHGLSFTVCSFPLPLIGSSSKIMRVFSSVSCYNLLPLGWPRYTAADSCRAWCSRRTRCWSSTLLSVTWWAIISAGLIIFCERLMYWPAKLSRWL